MATQADVRRLALALPDTTEDPRHFGFGVTVKGKPHGFVWAWRERVDPKKARVPSTTVIAIRTTDETEKHVLIAGDPETFFTEPHYDGYSAVLVRLTGLRIPRLRAVLASAHATVVAKATAPRARKRRV